jgi:hypothetical protein
MKQKTKRFCACHCGKRFTCDENCYGLKDSLADCYYLMCVSEGENRNSWVQCNQKLTCKGFIFR